MCSHFKTQLILSCPGRLGVFSEWIWFAGVSRNAADHMVRTKKGTHRSEWTRFAGVSQNGARHMVGTKKGSHRSKWTWCAGSNRIELIMNDLLLRDVTGELQG